MNRNLIFDLATAGWVKRREDCLFKGPPGTGKSHLAQANGHAVIQQGYRVLYRETHILLEELADATLFSYNCSIYTLKAESEPSLSVGWGDL